MYQDDIPPYLARFRQGLDQRYTDPPAALAIMQSARDEALADGNKRSVLYMNHWILQVLLHVTHDYNKALELGVDATVEARKPDYADQQERICVHEDLISAYYGIDPLGYGPLIQDALDYMKQETGDFVQLQCYLCVRNLEADFAIVENRIDQAKSIAQENLSACERNFWSGDFHRTYAYIALMETAYHHQDWPQMAQYAQLAAQSAAKKGNYQLTSRVTAVMGQALADRRRGDEVQANRYLHEARNYKARLTSVPDMVYYDLCCDYYEHTGDLQTAIDTRTDQIKTLTGKHRLYWEARARLEQIRLLKKQGNDTSTAVDDLQAILAQLQKPAPLQERLQAILSA